MGLFRRLEALEKEVKSLKAENNGLREKLNETESELSELKVRLPDYEEAIGKGVEERWEKGIEAIINYTPGIGKG